VWRPLPYLVAAAVLVLTTVVVVIGLGRRVRKHQQPERAARSPAAQVWSLVRDHPDIRYLMISNTLLTLAFGGLKTFVVLWLTAGLGRSMHFTAGAMAVVAVGTVAGAVASGKLGDRYGLIRVMEISLSFFGVAVLVGAFTRSIVILGAAFPFIAFAGGAAFVLPFAILMRRMPEESHGAAAGLFDMSNGMGTILGPAITGAAIDVLHPFFRSTEGYAAMWPVLSASTLLGVAVLRRARRCSPTSCGSSALPR
jgi:MFS family permease